MSNNGVTLPDDAEEPRKPRRIDKRALAPASPKSPSGGPISVELPPLNLQRIDVTLVGDTPLIQHKWSEKARKEMLDKQMKRAKTAKEAKNPQRDFEESVYIIGERNGRRVYGFPVIAFKAAAVTACTSIGGITKVQARQAFRILGEFAVIEGSEPKMREDMVRIGMGTADIRYRGEFSPWWTTLTISHNANVMSAEQILNMLNTAGFGVGVGEWRPEKDGQYGCFHVANEEDMEQIEAYRRDQEKVPSRNGKALK